MAKLKLALFDMDGLLIDSERMVFECWEEVGRQMGHTITKDEYVTYTGQRFDTIKVRFEENHPGLDITEFFRRDNELLSAAIDKGVPLKPGVHELLDKMDELGIERVIVTSSGVPHMTRLIGPLGILKRFKGHINGDKVKRSKPDPEIFLLAASTYGVEPENCLIFEDSIAGVTAAHNAGIPVIAVPDMRPLPTELTDKCVAVCKTLADAIPYVEEMAK